MSEALKRPLYDHTVRLIEAILIARARVVNQSPEEIIDFAWKIAEAYELRVERNLEDWSLWYKEQQRLAERNRAAARAAQTHCVYCERALDATSHMDHIQAIKIGGSGEITNLVYACSVCNLSKNGKDFWMFMDKLTKSVQSQIIRRLEKLGKRIPVEIPAAAEPSAG